MKLALVDNIRTGAKKGATGLCPCCGSQVIARCGEIRVDHWAHKGARHCDPWWENETEWHRSWKGNFSADWQEVVAQDEVTKEKHIADIKTDYGLVVEFQHSHLNPVERRTREEFYKKIVWVVDGTRLKNDYPRFLKNQHNFRPTNKRGVFLLNFPEEVFPPNWTSSTVPVIFDFKGIEPLVTPNDPRNSLYLLVRNNNNEMIMAIYAREHFIDAVKENKLFGDDKEIKKNNEPPPTAIKRNPPPSPYIFYKGRSVRRRRF